MEDDFDRQINDAFDGIGQQRTELAGLYRVAFERLCVGTRYTVTGAWEQGGINIALSYPHGEYTDSAVLYISQPDPLCIEAQARAALDFHHARVDSPDYNRMGTEPLI